MSSERSSEPAIKQKGREKTARIPIKVIPGEYVKPKPNWIRAKLPGAHAQSLIKQFSQYQLHTVCQEASCPNLGECYSKGTASFMILGDMCTRRCPFCDVAHGNPQGKLDEQEPQRLAQTIADMALKYVVITSVDRDDLADGGATHFVHCIEQIRLHNESIKIEILTPDFKKKLDRAIEAFINIQPDVFNHNLETVPSLYQKVRPGADYQGSLQLLKQFKSNYTKVPTKSGLMLGLGESLDEVKQVMQDLLEHDVSRLTLGQYLQPSRYHLAVQRYISPEEFEQLADYAKISGFEHVASGPLVRSSYHADLQAQGIKIK